MNTMMVPEQYWLTVLVRMSLLALTESSSLGSLFEAVKPGLNITGTKLIELVVTSRAECSLRCVNEAKCDAYAYRTTGHSICQLIRENPAGARIMNFTSGEKNLLYKIPPKRNSQPELQTACGREYEGPWDPPCPWTGPFPVRYWSFNTADGLVVFSGSVYLNYNFLHLGKYGKAVHLSRGGHNWLDMGSVQDACVTRPETCGAAGGAISLWVNIIEFPSGSGVVTSATSTSTGLAIYFDTGLFVLQASHHDGYFQVRMAKEWNWTHLVMVVAVNETQGISVYKNGHAAAKTYYKVPSSVQSGDSKMVAGRRYTDVDAYYATFQLDDLILFNSELDQDDVTAIYSIE